MHDVVIVGGGPAGLSAAIYLGRAKRTVLVIDSNKPMCRWEPHVNNYLAFPDGVSGDDLIRRGRQQAERYGSDFVEDTVETAGGKLGDFTIEGKRSKHTSSRLL